MSGAGSRRKGYTWEAAVVSWLRAQGWTGAERCAIGAPADVVGVAGVTIECKSHKAIDLASWVDQAKAAAALRPGDPRPFVVIAKRRGKTSVGEAYAITDMETFSRLLKEAGYQ